MTIELALLVAAGTYLWWIILSSFYRAFTEERS